MTTHKKYYRLFWYFCVQLLQSNCLYRLETMGKRMNPQDLVKLSEQEKIDRILELEARVQEVELESTFFRSVLSAIPDLIYVFDIDEERNIYINQDAHAFLGYEPSGQSSLDFSKFMHPDDFAQFPDMAQQIGSAGDGEVFNFEYRLKHGDDSWRHMQSRDLVFSRRDDGTPKQTLGIARDLTERQKIKDQLRKREREFRTLADNSPEFIARVDRDFTYLYVNQGFAEQLDMTPEQIIGTKTYDVPLHPNTVSTWKQKRQEIFDTGKTITQELAFDEEKGMLYYHTYLVPEFADDGSVQSVLSITRDITALKTAQSALEENQRNLRTLIENIQENVWSIDRNYNLIVCNKHMQADYEANFGVRLEAGDNIFKAIDEGSRDLWRQLFDRALAGEHLQFSTEYKGLVYETTMSPIVGADHQVEGVIVLSRNITERRHTEQQLKFQAEVLENIKDAIVSIDNDYCVTYLNRAAVSLYKLDLEASLGKSVSDLYQSEWYQPTDADIAMAELETQGYCFTELRHKKQDGTMLDVEATTNVLRDANGQQIGLLAVIRDVTERRKLEQLHRAIVNQSLLTFSVIDKNGKYIFANPALAQLIGYSVAELKAMTGEQAMALFAPEYRQQIGDNRVKRLSGYAVPANYEAALLHKNGTPIWMEMNISTGEYDGEMVVFCAGLNITARKLAQKQLKEQQELYTLIAENTSDIITLSDAEGKVVYYSPSTQSQLGYSMVERLGLTMWELVHPDDLPALLSARAQYIEAESGINQYRLRHKDGHYMWMETSVKVMRTEDGRIDKIIGITRNIEERKRAELELRESQHFIQSIADAVPYIIYVFDYDQQHDVFINQFGAQFFDIPQSRPEKLTRDLLSALFHPDDVPILYQLAKKLEASNYHEVTTFDARVKNASGEWRWLRYRIVPFKFSEDGQLQQTLGLCVDMTDQREMEQRAFKLALEQEKVRFLTEFIVSASHEFRTPLSVINTSLYMLQRQNDLSEDYPYILRIRERVSDILELVDAITTFARLERDVPSFSTVRVDQLLRNIVTNLSPKADKYQITIHVNADQPDPLINANEQNITLLLTEIVDNAIAFNQDGGDIFIDLDMNTDEHCIIHVRDTGIGIPEHAHDHLFESFYRVDPAQTTRGFGLGLAIAKIIVEQHQGDIAVKSAREGGTIVTVTLPITQTIRGEVGD